MCLGGDDPQDTPAAREAAAAEQARQSRIDEGMRQIERMFGGGQVGTGWVAPGSAYNPSQAYYTADLQPFSISPEQINARRMERNKGGSFGQKIESITQPDNFYSQELFNEATQGAGLYSGTEKTGGYDDAFFNKAYQAQLDYALPQVDRQFEDAQRQLQYGLARQGLSQSSQAGQLQAKLERERQLAVQGEQDKANTVRQKQRQAVEDERSNLVSMLQSTGDVQSTMNAAAARKGIIESAPAIEEVGPLFQNTTASLADMIVSPALRQASSGGGRGYASSKDSGKVIG